MVPKEIYTLRGYADIVTIYGQQSLLVVIKRFQGTGIIIASKIIAVLPMLSQ